MSQNVTVCHGVCHEFVTALKPIVSMFVNDLTCCVTLNATKE